MATMAMAATKIATVTKAMVADRTTIVARIMAMGRIIVLAKTTTVAHINTMGDVMVMAVARIRAVPMSSRMRNGSSNLAVRCRTA